MFFREADQMIMNIYLRIFGYLKIIKKMSFSPSKSIHIIGKLKEFPYALFFLINILVVCLLSFGLRNKIDETTSSVKFSYLFISGVNSNQMVTFISYIVGAIFLSILMKIRFRSINYRKITRAIFLSSSIFIPIFFIERILLSLFPLLFGSPDELVWIVVIAMVLIFLFIVKQMWYAYVISCGLLFFSKRKIFKVFSIIMLASFVSGVISLAPLIEKASAVLILNQNIEKFIHYKENKESDIDEWFEMQKLATMINYSLVAPDVIKYKYGYLSMGYSALLDNVLDSKNKEESIQLIVALEKQDLLQIKQLLSKRETTLSDFQFNEVLKSIEKLESAGMTPEKAMSNSPVAVRVTWSSEDESKIGKFISIMP